MKISTKGRHALRVMTDIAEHETQIVSIKDMSLRQQISPKYLEQIISLLCKADLLESFRGHMGGYKLKRPVDKITVGEILTATEGQLFIVECLDGANPCDKASQCKTVSCWKKLNTLINDYLNQVTLKDIVDKNN